MVNIHYVCFSGYRGKIAEEITRSKLSSTHSVTSSGIIFNDRISLIRNHFSEIFSYFQKALEHNLFEGNYAKLATQIITNGHYLNSGGTKHVFFQMFNITLDALLKDREKKTISVLKGNGYAIENFESKPFKPKESDSVIAVDVTVKEWVGRIYQGNIMLLEDFAPNKKISMPLGGSEEDNTQSFDEIKKAVENSLEDILH